MTNETAALLTEKNYLERELSVWRGRLERAPNYSLYDDHDLRKELGRMKGKLERITLELGSAITPTKGCGGKRRAKIAA